MDALTETETFSQMEQSFQLAAELCDKLAVSPLKGAIDAAPKTLHAEIVDLIEDAQREVNIDHRFTLELSKAEKLASAETPTQFELFRLAHVQKFPKRREFKKPWIEKPLGAEQTAKVSEVAAPILEAMRDADAQEFIDAVIPDALAMLVSSLTDPAKNEGTFDAVEAGMKLLAADVLESINNILKRIVEAVLAAKSKLASFLNGIGSAAKEAIKQYGEKARQSIIKEAGRLGDETGPAITKLAKCLFGLALLHWLA
jgi:hypothetical protein